MTSPTPDDATTTVAAEHDGQAVVLRITGDIDSATAPGVRATVIETVAASTGPVVVDLSAVGYLSSSGLRLLMDVRDLLAAEGRALRVVTGGARTITRPLEVTGLDRQLRLYPDLPSALAD